MTRRLLTSWRLLVDEVRYAIAATRWEGWGARNDPRNERAPLTRAQWRRQQTRCTSHPPETP